MPQIQSIPFPSDYGMNGTGVRKTIYCNQINNVIKYSEVGTR